MPAKKSTKKPAKKPAKKSAAKKPAKKPTKKPATKPATKPAKPATQAAAPAPATSEGIPFPFIGAGDASYFEWADLHVYFTRDVTPAERAKLTKSIPPPIDDPQWEGRLLYLSSEQGVGRVIQATYSKPAKKPTSLTTTSRFKIPDGPKLSAFNADIERYLLEAHAIVPILAAFRRQDSEAGGTRLSPWHEQSLPHGPAVLQQLHAERGSTLEYMVHGIKDELSRAKK